ncbi:SIS domain-containing protein [Acidisoma cellulosilytica]|uniref:SIS domain-containing protein n=1 Tax=Acidisoma cellulosilyticum TaxID=2802395 RepID=A0A963Z3K7_9PROT|nr:SIS domain-containing protein [Acidisoma cellulosilyticum]MCB8881360.1 SIS domain-containing protein [Acidisoma cellulosilyticum]
MKIDLYMHEQPKLLASLPTAIGDILSRLSTLAVKPERLVLVGTGSSMNALIAAATALEQATGALVTFKEPEAFLHLPPRPSAAPTLVIAVSQSGRSTSTVEAVRLSVSLGFPTLAIVGDDGSPLAETGADIVLMPIGEELAGPKTKGYTASVLSLLAVASHLGGKPLETSGLEAALDIALAQSDKAAQWLLSTYGIPDYIQVAGQHGHVGSALEASLKIAEITGVPTAGFDIEEALHGHVYGTTDRSLVLIIARDAAEAKVAANLGRALTALGPRLAVCNLSDEPTPYDLAIDWPAVPESWADATWALFPFQWYAWHVARAKGMEQPGMIYPNLGKQLNVKIRPVVV